MVSRLRRVVALVVLISVIGAAGSSPFAEPAYGQAAPLLICGAEGKAAPVGLGTPTAEGWVNEQEALGDPSDIRRYQFTVAEKGTAYVYVGDQWYNLDLGLFSMKTRSEACWRVESRGLSQESQRRVLQFVRPDERAIEVEPGDYILTIRAGDAAGFDASKNFTVRIAVGPRVCSLVPANIPVPEYPGMTMKPENPDQFQIGVAIQPDPSELSQFSLMTFSAFISPPYTDLFDFAWEIDGQPVAGVAEPNFNRPFKDLPQTSLGLHTVKLTVKGAREYKDPTESRYNFTPFDGGSRTVICQFRAPS